MNTMLGRLFNLFLFFCCLSSISCVSWSTLTAAELSAISPDEFGGITSDQLASIPAQAFAGFNENQFEAIPAAAMSGLSAPQMQNLAGAACSGFNASQFSQLSTATISALTSDCMDNVRGAVVAQISAEQLSAFTPQICGIFWPGLMYSIPAESFAGLTPKCAANITASALHLVNADGLSHIRPDVFRAFSANQLSFFPGVSYSSISAEQLRAVNPASCIGFESRHITTMPASAAPGLTPECAANFGSGINGLFLANMASTTFAAFSATQIGTLSPSTIEYIRADQFSAMNPAACAGFISQQTALFPPSAAPGINSSCFARFQTLGLACMGLSPEFIEAMDSAAGAGLTPDCMTLIDMATTCNGFGPQFFANIPPDAFSSMSVDCVELIRPEAVQQMSAQQIRNIHAQEFSGFKTTFQYLSNETLMATTVEQLGNLSAGLGGMTAEQMVLVINTHQLDIVNRWSELQLLATSFAFMQNVPSRVPLMVSWYNIDIKSVTWLQIALLKTDPAPKFTAGVIAQLPGYAVLGFRADQVRTLTPTAIAAFNVDHARNFSRDLTAAFSGEQLAALTPTALGEMSLEGIIGIRPEVIPSLTASQLQQLTDIQLGVMSCDQMNSFTETQRSHIELHLLAALQERIEAVCEDIVEGPQADGESGSPDGSKSSFPPPKVILIVLVCLTGLSIAAGVIVFFVKRRRAMARADWKAEPLLIH